MKWAMSVAADTEPAEQNPPCVDVAGDQRRTNLLTAVLRVRVVRVLGNINNEKLKLQQRMNIQTILNISVQHTEKLLITNRRRTYNIARIHGNHCHREWSSHWD